MTANADIAIVTDNADIAIVTDNADIAIVTDNADIEKLEREWKKANDIIKDRSNLEVIAEFNSTLEKLFDIFKFKCNIIS